MWLQAARAHREQQQQQQQQQQHPRGKGSGCKQLLAVLLVVPPAVPLRLQQTVLLARVQQLRV
jgi:hypothetical protein